MRTIAVFAATALLTTGALASTAAAQGTTPSTNEIIKSLTPSGAGGPTRGIRVAPVSPATPQAPGQQPMQANTPMQGRAPIHSPAQQPVAAISLTVQFATGSADLTPQAIRVLNNLGSALRDETLKSYHFRIEGHTDTVGSHDFNRLLSERRAAAVVDYITTNFQVDRGRVQAVGMGKDGLLIQTPDQTPEPRNRRVLVVNVGS